MEEERKYSHKRNLHKTKNKQKKIREYMQKEVLNLNRQIKTPININI